MKLVKIEWIDASSFSGGDWKDREQIQDLEPTQIMSVGWVIREDTKSVTLCPHMSEHQGYGEMAISKSAIVKKRVLK